MKPCLNRLGDDLARTSHAQHLQPVSSPPPWQSRLLLWQPPPRDRKLPKEKVTGGSKEYSQKDHNSTYNCLKLHEKFILYLGSLFPANPFHFEISRLGLGQVTSLGLGLFSGNLLSPVLVPEFGVGWDLLDIGRKKHAYLPKGVPILEALFAHSTSAKLAISKLLALAHPSTSARRLERSEHSNLQWSS